MEDVKKINISIALSELLFNINEIAYLSAESSIDKDEKAKSFIKDITQEGQVSMLTTCLNRSFEELMHAISHYVCDNSNDNNTLYTNEYIRNDFYNIVLYMPLTFDNNVIQSVVGSMHDFLINKAIGRYYVITNKNEAEVYLYNSDNDLIRVKKYLSARTKHIKRGYGII